MLSCYPVHIMLNVSRIMYAAMLSALHCANGAIATGSIIVATRYFQESSNRVFVVLFLSQGFGLSIRLHHIFTKVLQNLAVVPGFEPGSTD